MVLGVESGILDQRLRMELRPTLLPVVLVTEQLNVPILIARPAFRIRDDVIEVQVGCPEATDVAAHAAVA